MNYAFQLDGLHINGQSGNFDYSTFQLDADESSLSETTGLTIDPFLARFGTQYFCGSGVRRTLIVESIAAAVDWNCNGQNEQLPVASDINGDGIIRQLAGWDDWKNIALVPPAANLGVAPHTLIKPREELTPALAEKISVPPVNGVSAKLVNHAVALSWNPIGLDRLFAYKLYRTQGGKTQEVATSERTDAVDPRPASGMASYFVVALLVPHSRATAELPRVLTADIESFSKFTAAMSSEMESEANISRTSGVVADRQAIERIGKSAPVKAGIQASIGAKVPPVQTPATLPSALLVTAPSKSVAIEVK